MNLRLPNRYKDRFDAARQLVGRLAKFSGRTDVVLLAIPRGAVQIGSFLVRELKIPLDVILVKKIPAPGSEELAMGAVAIDGGQVLDVEMVREFTVSQELLDAERQRLIALMKEKDVMYHATAGKISIKDKTVILLDDGIATGHTMQAAVEFARRQGVSKVIVASPATSNAAAQILEKITDELISLKTEKQFLAVGTYYVNFPQVEDDEAIQLLAASRGTLHSK